ncbi:hypothetical protein LJB88_03800 [Erysipelotrichaceae bacterium OttesenSCG-928-M19]|nr:hypothetical protein [Erysipelotrichaceae bacterium OttesenSCG-928-M19]
MSVSAKTTTYNFKTLKLNSGFKYKLFHSNYTNDLANHKKVVIYYDLSEVSNKQIKKSFNSTVALLNSNRGSKKNIYLTTTKPSGKNYYTNKVYIDYSDDWAYAYANSSLIGINKKTLKVSSNLQKRILFHEILHTIGLDHVSSKTKGSAMTPAVMDGSRKFSIKNYPKDKEAWKILNKSYNSKKSGSKKKRTYKTYFLNTYLYKKVYKVNNKNRSIKYYFYSSKISTYYKYNSKGKLLSKFNYYNNGKYQAKTYYYSNKKTKLSLSYFSNRKISARRDYYYNGILKQQITYHSNGKYNEIKKYNSVKKMISYYKYNSSGKLIQSSLYYSTGVNKLVKYYDDLGQLIKQDSYYQTGVISERRIYENNVLIQIIKYDASGNEINDKLTTNDQVKKNNDTQNNTESDTSSKNNVDELVPNESLNDDLTNNDSNNTTN